MSDSAPSLEQQIRGQLAGALVRQTLVGAVVANIGLPTVFALASWNAVPHAWVLAWWGGAIALFVLRALSVKALHRRFPDSTPTRPWVVVGSVGLLCSGALWGAASGIFLWPSPVELRLFLGVIVLGIVCGGAVAIAPHLPSYYGFAALAAGPYVAATLMQREHTVQLAGYVTIMLTATWVWMAVLNHRALRDGAKLRFENRDLLVTLERERNEAQAARNVAEQAHTSKSAFLAAASHDLRQPVHALSLCVGELREWSNTAGLPDRLIVRIEASIEALSAVLRALLDISRLDSGTVAPQLRDVEIGPLLERLCRSFRAEADDKKLDLRLLSSSAWVRTDPDLLSSIVGNLIANAVRHTEHGRVTVGCRRRASCLSIQVWDTGPGIPADRRRDIFREFVQLHNPERDRSKGIGLGLAVVERTAKLLGHPIRLESREAAGSMFAVDVPYGHAARVPKLAAAMGATREAGVLNGAVVAIVDDEAAVRESVVGLLRYWGCSVIAAGDGDELLRQCEADRRAPDVLLADYRLRGSEDGAAVIERVRAHYGLAIPAALVSGDTSPERIREARASGFQLAHKPLSPRKLRELVEELLNTV